LLALWPIVLLISLFIWLIGLRRSSSIQSALPFIVIVTVLGAFLSQQLWGSTYALWPLFAILLACIFARLTRIAAAAQNIPFRAFTFIACGCLFAAGAAYAFSYERLSYADVTTGDIYRSTLPALRGLSIRGPWIPWFEELVRYSDAQVPREDGLLMIPGEDLFYYATGRQPRFPVLMFDHTVNPYSPEQVVFLSRSLNIKWLVVKRKLQLTDQPYEDEGRVLQLLQNDFEPVAQLGNYDVYRRR